MLHRSVGLDPFGRQVVPRLDGQHDRNALLMGLVEAVEAGELTAEHEGMPVQDVQVLKAALDENLDQKLQELARLALLIG
ncbi:MAG: hypothetical protein K2R98_33635 [Gemmataceae bacterium]|nr:hypothetical protein [Gemmataceae bacterium]